MSEYLEKMREASYENTENELYFKLATLVKTKRFDYYCVVEGKDDEGFYCHVNHPFFKENNIIYISQHSQETSDDAKTKYLVGKRAVVKTCETALDSLKFAYKHCVFIVDHDYFGLEEFKIEFSKMCLESITVLPVYSFENYFTLSENLQWIVKKYLPCEEHEEFYINFNDFCEKLITYCAYKGIITRCHYNGKYHIDYHNENDDGEIFRFNFNDKNYYDIASMNNEIMLMSKGISEYPELIKSVASLRIKLSKNKDLLKGKILYKFVKYYLLHKNEIRALDPKTDEYAQVVSNLKVKIKVVTNDN